VIASPLRRSESISLGCVGGSMTTRQRQIDEKPPVLAGSVVMAGDVCLTARLTRVE